MAANADSDLKDIQAFLLRLLSEQREQEAVQMVVELLRTLRKKNTQLQMRLHKALRQQYGRKSEGISSQQLSLFLQQLEDTGQKIPEDLDAVDLEDDDLNGDNDDDNGDDGARVVEIKAHERRVRRRPIPTEIQRVQHIHRVEGDARICPACEAEKARFGYEVTRILEFVPAHFELHEYMMEQLACRPCGEHVSTA